MYSITDLTTWVKKIYQHPLLTTASNYSYQTISYVIQQARALPAVVHSMVNNPPTHTVVRHLLRIVGEDLIPLVLVTYSNSLIQNYGKSYLEEEPDYPWLSAKTAIELNLYLLQTAAWVYSIRKQSQLLVRTTIVTLEAPFLLHKPRLLPPSHVCLEEQCSTLRFAQGSARDVVTFWATEIAISLIGYAPITGSSSTAAFLSIYHRGRYVLTIVLPEVCNRHQVNYLREHSELALSLGLGHALTSGLLNTALEMSTGIPRVFYASTIEQLLLLTQISVAAHLSLPEPEKTSKRTLPDPVLLYQYAIGFLFDVILLGLKVKIPRMMSYHDTDKFTELLKKIPFEDTLGFLMLIHHHPMAHLFLPQLLHSTEEFLADPIVASNWEELRFSIIKSIEIIEKLHNHTALRLSSFAPEVASTLIQTIFGTPKFINKPLLKMIMDPVLIDTLSNWRSSLQTDNFVVVDHEPSKELTPATTPPRNRVVSAPSRTMRHRFHGQTTPTKLEEEEWVLVESQHSQNGFRGAPMG